MAADHERTPKLCQLPHRCLHLVDDGIDADTRTEIVGRNGDADAVSIQPPRAMAEGGAIERLPIAAMNEDDDWSIGCALEKIDGMALSRPIADDAPRVELTIGGGIPHPPRHQRWMFGNARPVVVLGLVVDRGHGRYGARR